ncbi:MAG: hypothetical protein K9J16_12725 [Melioribacteraceae bacterium]|nr:hypothetical protein [Melioribacteraceae bacterium]MCF8354720.1 hypothetical protein [Melioribacteraceae bacterium]MCF8394349.1 hypothetical protein [Melioribacteraceae bacterium]MCF8420059.1 hypothetical protein [Melioribacteraceae bacterium]
MNVLNISQILFYFSWIIWIGPIIRNYKNQFFLFFVFVAMPDLVNAFVFWVVNTSPTLIVSITFVFLQIPALLGKQILMKYLKSLIFFYVSILVIYFVVDIHMLNFAISPLINLFIFLIILKKFAVDNVESERVNIFYIVLLFYKLTIIFKFFVMIIGTVDATPFFIVTTIIQIIFGLYFSIFTEDKPGYVFKL